MNFLQIHIGRVVAAFALILVLPACAESRFTLAPSSPLPRAVASRLSAAEHPRIDYTFWTSGRVTAHVSVPRLHRYFSMTGWVRYEGGVRESYEFGDKTFIAFDGVEDRYDTIDGLDPYPGLCRPQIIRMLTVSR